MSDKDTLGNKSSERSDLVKKVREKKYEGKPGEHYRDLLETWVAWWNGPGRRGYRGSITPPLSETAGALNCIFCADVGQEEAAESGLDRCVICLKELP